jgi:hypothetical protein
VSARRLLLPLGLLVCLVVSVWCTRFLFTAHLNNPSEVISSLVDLPERAIGLVSLEFDGVLSDYLMLKTMVFLGEKMERKERPSEREWHLVLRSLEQTTNLDDRFWDPYLLAAMTFPWEAGGMIPETCALLEKAALARPEDHRPYFFLWFIKAQFEKDMVAAAKYIRLASTKPGAPGYYATLAARMDYYAGNPLTGALFLEEILATTASGKTHRRAQAHRLSRRKGAGVQATVRPAAGAVGGAGAAAGYSGSTCRPVRWGVFPAEGWTGVFHFQTGRRNPQKNLTQP